MRKGKFETWITMGLILKNYYFRLVENPFRYNRPNEFWYGGPNYRESVPGTGRGGWLKDLNGDMGRPPAIDESYVIEPILAGAGGSQGDGGRGTRKGKLGYGGNGASTPSDGNNSGGGGGLFGGGSGYITGGGGGGSSGVLLKYDIRMNPEIFDLLNKPSGILTGKEVTNEYDYVDYNDDLMYSLNTEWMNYYYETVKPKLSDKAWSDFINIREQAKGNGFIMISFANERIKFDNINGFTGLDRVIHYTEEFADNLGIPVPFYATASYHIICFGACGGSVFQWTSIEERYSGGFGGVCAGILALTAGITLYAFLGEKGSRQAFYNPYNGGGNCGIGGSTSGGGATDLRYQGDLLAIKTRLIVAGGGGGLYSIAMSDTMPENTPKMPKNTDYSFIDTSNSSSVGQSRFYVNDKSKAYVTINYITPAEFDGERPDKIILILQNGEEGTIEKEVELKENNGVLEAEFDLSEVYPVGTPTHEITIEAVLDTDKIIYIPKDGVTIRVETEVRPDESYDFEKKSMILKLMESVNVVERASTVTITIDSKHYILNLHDYIHVIGNIETYITGVLTLVINALENIGLYDLSSIDIQRVESLELLIKASDNITIKDIQQTELMKELMGVLNIKEDIQVSELLKLLTDIVGSTNSISMDSLNMGDNCELNIRRD